MNRMDIINDYQDAIISAINKTLDSLYETIDTHSMKTNTDFETIEQASRAYERLRKKIQNGEELSNFEFAETVIVITNVAEYLRKMSLNYNRTAVILEDISNQLLEENN